MSDVTITCCASCCICSVMSDTTINCCACCNVMSKCYECKFQWLLQSLRWCATTVGGRCVAHNAAGASIRPCGAPSATSVYEVGNCCRFYADHTSLCSHLLHLPHWCVRWVASRCCHLLPLPHRCAGLVTFLIMLQWELW